MSRTGNYQARFPNKARGFLRRYRLRCNTSIVNGETVQASMIRPRRYFINYSSPDFQVITQAI